MFSVIAGSLIISVLHALIPNHWLPVLAIGKKESWTLKEVLTVTFMCALAHGLSTIIIGVALGVLGKGLDGSLQHFTKWIAPGIMIGLGIVFIYRHHTHKHFRIEGEVKKRSKTAIITALLIAMFFSPCLEIEAYFLLAGTFGTYLIWVVAIMYLLITTAGMLLLIRLAYNGLLKLNWHKVEHNAGIITGITLILTGVVSFIIN